MRTWQRCFMVFILAAALAGCWGPKEPDDPRTASLREMLAYTPSSAQVTVAAPTIATLDDQLTKLNLAGTATVQEALRTAGLIAGLDDADSAQAIADALHLDSSAPLTIHLRSDEQLANRDLVIIAAPLDMDAAVAKAAEVVDAESGNVSDINEGTKGAFAVAPGVIAIGTNVDFLRECFESAAEPLFGSAACPPTSPESIAVLARLSAVSDFARVGGLSMIEDYMLAATGDRIVVETWMDGPNARAMVRVPREGTSESKALKLAPMLPPACESFAGWSMSPETKDAIREQWMSTMPQALEGDPIQALAASQLESFLHAIGDEVAFGALGLESARPQFVGMFALRDANQAASILGALSPLFKEVAREGEAAIYGLPPQMGVPIAYAIHEGILILGPDAELIAGGIVQLSSARPTKLYEGAVPGLDPSESAMVRAVLSQRLLADLVVPLAKSGGAEDRALNLIELASRASAIQIHALNADGWDRWSFTSIP